MSQWGVQATDSWFFWHIVDATDYVTPETGLVSTDICVNLAYSTSAVKSKYALGAGDWVELGGGGYKLQMGAGEWAASGAFLVEVGGVAGGLNTARTIVNVLPYSLNALSTSGGAADNRVISYMSGPVAMSTDAANMLVKLDVIQPKVLSLSTLANNLSTQTDAIWDELLITESLVQNVDTNVTTVVSGGVKLNAQGIIDVNQQVDTALDTVIPVAVTSGSINAVVKNLNTATSNLQAGVILTTAGLSTVADSVLDEQVSAHTNSGSLGNFMRAMVRALTGYVDTDIATGVMSVHDGKDAGDAELLTLTLADDGTTVTRTPSVEP